MQMFSKVNIFLPGASDETAHTHTHTVLTNQTENNFFKSRGRLHFPKVAAGISPSSQALPHLTGSPTERKSIPFPTPNPGWPSTCTDQQIIAAETRGYSQAQPRVSLAVSTPCLLEAGCQESVTVLRPPHGEALEDGTRKKEGRGERDREARAGSSHKREEADAR